MECHPLINSVLIGLMIYLLLVRGSRLECFVVKAVSQFNLERKLNLTADEKKCLRHNNCALLATDSSPYGYTFDETGARVKWNDKINACIATGKKESRCAVELGCACMGRCVGSTDVDTAAYEQCMARHRDTTGKALCKHITDRCVVRKREAVESGCADHKSAYDGCIEDPNADCSAEKLAFDTCTTSVMESTDCTDIMSEYETCVDENLDRVQHDCEAPSSLPGRDAESICLADPRNQVHSDISY